MPRSLAMEILSAIASSARNHHADGPDAERDFEVGEFERLEVAGPFDVNVQTGGSVGVHASGPEWALDNLRIELEDDRLFIGCEGDCDGDVNVSVSVRACVPFAPRDRATYRSTDSPATISKARAAVRAISRSTRSTCRS
jgi:hypothetical protein